MFEQLLTLKLRLYAGQGAHGGKPCIYCDQYRDRLTVLYLERDLAAAGAA